MLPINKMYELYDKFNHFFFADKLPKTKIEYSDKLGTAAGTYSPKNKIISLSIPLLSGREQDQKDVLAHEMIHAAQDYFNIKERPHGPFFSACMAKINSAAKGKILVTTTHNIYQIKDYEESVMLGRIKKLLALADSPNQNEAFAAAKKAQVLMAEHGVRQTDLNDVEAGSELDEPLIDEVIEASARITTWKFALLSAISSVNYCTCLSRTNIGIFVMGNRTHVEICRSYYQYFCQLIDREAEQHRGKGSVFLNRFREGMVAEIEERLNEQFQKQSAEAQVTSSKICLASQYNAELKNFVRMLHPRIGVRQGSARVGNAEATNAGRQSGAKAGIGKHIVSGSKRLVAG